ncbi:hypothetical protein [Spiroplasma endosymbiont of Nephrotoma flavescens]|uniref:hypothetical protein n=1 Tax=Spiroplasma endosymbiont of Nephrotoma flavescens TaxID=3066302 RepID=UPI00313CB0EA
MQILKKLVSFTSTILISSSPIVTVIACSKSKDRIDSNISEKTQEEQFIKLLEITDKNNITGKALFDKFKGKISEYGFNAIKEIIARNEFVTIYAKMRGKKIENLSETEITNYLQQFDNLWNQIAGDKLYQEYLKARLNNSFLEAIVTKQGYDIKQSAEWHILGTWDEEKDEAYTNTIQPSINDLMTAKITSTNNETINYKVKVRERFADYYNAQIKATILDNLMTMTWLQDRIFELKKDGNYSLPISWTVPKNVQTFDSGNVWDSKIKMVWEVKVKKENEANLPNDDVVLISDNDTFKNKFKPDNNEIKTIFDPIFNMAGFRGFVAYGNDNNPYGDNTMEDFYKEQVKERQIVGFASSKAPNDSEINKFYTEDRRYVSKIYVLPIFVTDLFKGYKIDDDKEIQIDNGIEFEWKNNTNKTGTKKNSARNNTGMQNLPNNQKTSLINELLFTISKDDNLKKNASQYLYTKYIVTKKNIYDKKIWEDLSTYFQDEEDD